MRVSPTPMSIILSSKAGNELAGADHEFNALAGAAVEGYALDGALEADGDAVADLGLGAIALGGIGTALLAMRLIALSTSASATSTTGFSTLKLLKSAELDRRHDLDLNRVGQIGLSGEKFFDLILLGRHRDLGFVGDGKPGSVKICVLVSRMV